MNSSLTKAAVVSLCLFILSARLCAQTTEEQKSPLTKSQVDALVVSGLDSQRIAAVVKKRGINFQPADDYLDNLRSKGATQALLDALSAAAPRPLSKIELLHLLAAGTASDDLVPIVQRQGIDFKPTPEDLDTLRIAGAGETLLKTLRGAEKATSTASPNLLAPPDLSLPQMAPPSDGPPTRGIYGVGGNVSAPVPTYQPDPPYSDEARRAKIAGTVVLGIVVDARGSVGDVRVVNSLGYGLDQEAVQTVKTWKFKPAMRNGTPVAVLLSVEVTFRLFGSRPPRCTIPFVWAQMDWEDAHKVTWDYFAEDVIYWWTRQSGSTKFPRICEASRQAARYAIVWRKGPYPYSSTIRVEVYRLAGGDIQYPPLFISKNATSSKGAFKDAAKYLSRQAPEP